MERIPLEKSPVAVYVWCEKSLESWTSLIPQNDEEEKNRLVETPVEPKLKSSKINACHVPDMQRNNVLVESRGDLMYGWM